MPDTIQFRNGNQIVHRYDASGRRLSTRYVTIYFQLAQPLNQGEVVYGIDVCYEDNVTIAGNDYVGNIEYYTFRYFDYDLSGIPVDSYTANKVYFDQGYINRFEYVNTSPRYYYFRHDQLGNIREVWAAAYIHNGNPRPAATVQRIQYYPSGLPWKDNGMYSPSGQNRKYNGKEFVEMHGLDEYDYQARWYYPAIMRTTTMDPLAEKYYDISPYAWCGNNPVKFVDPDGRAPRLAKMVIKTVVKSVAKGKLDLGDVYDLVVAGKTLLDPNSSMLDKGLAVFDILSPVSNKEIKAGAKMLDVVDGANDAKKVGSYTITFEKGNMKYHGKGPKSRMEQSAKEQSKKHDNLVKSKEWKEAKNDREAFKDESKRIENDGGSKNTGNYNQRKSPGDKYRTQDGE